MVKQAQAGPAGSPWKAFLIVILVGWVALGAAGWVYAHSKHIPGWVAWPAVAAFLILYPFYLAPAFPSIRRKFAGRRLAAFLLAVAVLPYLAASLGAVAFQWISLGKLVLLATVMAFWYVLLPAGILADLGFLALFPAVLLGGYLPPIYHSLNPGGLKDLVILGHISLIIMAVMVLLVQRQVPESGYGFLPSRKEWGIGALYFLYFVPIGFPLALLLEAAHISSKAPPWNIPVQFLAFLWVLALSEEFLLRGVLQSWIEAWTWSRTAALLVTSALYGLIHIGFRTFPNWRWVLVTAILGCFCGLAKNRAGSIRASMVTHALAVTAWRAFFVA